MPATQHLVNATDITVTRTDINGRHRIDVTVAPVAPRRKPMNFVWIDVRDTDEQLAQMAYEAANPKPHPEALKAAKLAAARNEDVCDKCSGLGGWRGWPGYTCHKCNGRRTIER